MKFKFKIQQYQTDAVDAVVGVFAGQPSKRAKYTIDQGRRKGGAQELFVTGERNAEVELSQGALLENIRKAQSAHDIPQSKSLAAVDGLGACALDVEMETGTGKTYVYIKTMHELHKFYGWSKFIVVVPSVAIREGVKKSFEMLEEHFMECYGEKARFFVYSSGNLAQIDSYSSDARLNVMIINMQAFARSFKEGANNSEARIIYSERDDFQSRRPIDVIAANRPIIIMDEPQRMEGAAVAESLPRFKPLFTLYYSATHKSHHDCVYSLDALDAYRQRLVKKIDVKGITLKNLLGSQAYIYFDGIVLSKAKPPEVRLEVEIKTNAGQRRKTLKFRPGDSLHDASGLNAYEGFTVSEIDPVRNVVGFQNGVTLRVGEVTGDVSEASVQRVQLRETIKSHLKKERTLFRRGIKTLSIFFIDEVANYKAYDAAGEVVKGSLWKMFEEEYARCVNEERDLFDEAYRRYLDRFVACEVHTGYFSIDGKGRAVNSHVGRRSDVSDDVSAYDLILKDKERLLSFAEPTRFIFSHSALREGWDNPNVFQICTLRHANSTVSKRQEVGRGLRICVDKDGNRMDAETLGDDVHNVNRLTVVANESYSDFVSSLQDETTAALRDRPKLATVEYFKGRQLKLEGGGTKEISEREAIRIISYLDENGYIDEKGNIQPKYREDKEAGTLAPMDVASLKGVEDKVQRLVEGIFDPSALAGLTEDVNARNEVENRRNENFDRKEFRALWDEINHKYVYTVQYDSEELIRKCVDAIDGELSVAKLKYVITEGTQGGDEIEFSEDGVTTRTHTLDEVSTSEVEYDLVGEIAKGATLTRRSVAKILRGISRGKLMLFTNNPEEFIRQTVRIIKEQKATMIVEHISYNRIEGRYDSDIFTQDKGGKALPGRDYPAKKHILDYVCCDSKGERKFAEDMDGGEEVCVYAKLPRSFHIPTPVGNYAPDWAIAFNDNMGVKHVFFVAETKGSMSSMDLKKIEQAKISCAEKLFAGLSNSKVRYHKVTDYQTMLQVLDGMK